MIKTALKSKIFIRIWLWSLLWGIVCGVSLSVLFGFLTGLFKPQTGGDDMAQGLIFAFLLFIIGNLSNYVTALILGTRFTQKQGQKSEIFLMKAVPLCAAFFLISWVFPPLLLFGSVLSALAVVIAINKNAPTPQLPEGQAQASPDH